MTQQRSDKENLARAFAALFAGRKDAWGTLQGGCIKETLKISHIIKHLEGNQSLGRYPLLDDGTCKWAVVDFDFKSDPNRVELAETSSREFASKLFEIGIKSSCFERSKSGLIHLWLFFSKFVEARKIRRILQFTARELNLKIVNGNVEIFPKQETLENGQIGNYIHLPYFSALSENPLERRVILDYNRLTPVPLEILLNQANQLLISPQEVDAVFESLPEEYVIRSAWDSKSKEISNQHPAPRQSGK